MNEVTTLILGVPLIVAISRFAVSGISPEEVTSFLILTFYVGLNGFMAALIGGRLHKKFRQSCISDYSNLQLIETLERSEKKLQAEQAALLSANAVIQQFYSSAAHDLRQPIYAMEIYTDMLSNDPTKLESLLPKISQSCMSINDMFNNLFDFQQIHLGDMEIEKSSLSIPNTFKSLALHFEPIAATKNLHISFKPLDGCVSTIPLYFIRILSNLIANAITYTPSGRILVAVRKSGEHIGFEVWDTGVGIEKASQEKIFQAFYQEDSSGRKTNNLGLGLAIVKDLVERLDHAKIRVTSIVGQGSVFKLLLPIENYTTAQHLKPVESSVDYDL
jgi:signal transduction histidine kinase